MVMAKKQARRSVRPLRQRPTDRRKTAAQAVAAKRRNRARPAARKAKRKRRPPGGRRRRDDASPGAEAGREKPRRPKPPHGQKLPPPPTRRRPGRRRRAAAAAARPRPQQLRSKRTSPTPPSSLDLDRHAVGRAHPGAARCARRSREHNETSPELTGGDVDADWEDAYSVGDEAPGGDNPTPDQDRVDDIGKALGVEYQDNEELRGSDKITDRDRHRWELDPASSEDYRDRD